VSNDPKYDIAEKPSPGFPFVEQSALQLIYDTAPIGRVRYRQLPRQPRVSRRCKVERQMHWPMIGPFWRG
jgi:hypothetical protein